LPTTAPQVSTKLKRRILIMDKKKIIVVVADGCVEAVFTNGEGDFELEIVDFDSNSFIEDQKELADYVDHVRATMKEV
jgi:hypothetical protein